MIQARDAAGNATTTTTTHAVAYGVHPLYDESKAVKSGSTIPITLQLSDAAGLAAGLHQLRFTVTGDPTSHTVGFVVGK